MRVYKFLDKQFGLMALRDRRLKIGRLAEWNDPFELLPFASTGRVPRLSVTTTLGELDARFGWICFSRTWSNPIIWAHYADQHRGLCLGFDVPDAYCKPIRYVEHREPFPNFDAMPEQEKLEAMERMLFTKFSQWAYEDESRVPVLLDQKTKTPAGFFFKDFDGDLKLAEVIVGTRGATCRRELEAAFGSTEGVEIIRAEAATDRFAIVPSNDAVRNHDDLTYYVVRGRMLHPVQFYRDADSLDA